MILIKVEWKKSRVQQTMADTPIFEEKCQKKPNQTKSNLTQP